jgi:nicotinamidase-related amidase
MKNIQKLIDNVTGHIDIKSVACVAVDPQLTFSNEGTLCVENANNEYFTNLYIFLQWFKIQLQLQILITQDSHPINHISFFNTHMDKHPGDIYNIGEIKIKAINKAELFKTFIYKIIDENGYVIKTCEQTMWPIHGCKDSQNNYENESLHPLIESIMEDDSENVFIFPKGTTHEGESYSGVKDLTGVSTGLVEHMNAHLLNYAIVVGICGDICVFATILDLLEMGQNVIVVIPLCPFFDTSKIDEICEAIKNKAIETCKSLIIILDENPENNIYIN